MPGYSYPGYPYKGMILWFGLQRSHIGLYLRPPTIARHLAELRGFGTTKSALHLPYEGELPTPLLRRMVLASRSVVLASRPRPDERRRAGTRARPAAPRRGRSSSRSA